MSRALNGARESIYSRIKVFRFKLNNTVLGRVNSEHDLAWTVAHAQSLYKTVIIGALNFSGSALETSMLKNA